MKHEDINMYSQVIGLIRREYDSATKKFGRFNNAHEGYAVLLEEVDELWEAIKLNQKRNKDRNEKITKEAIQVGAMAIRVLMDCCFVYLDDYDNILKLRKEID